MNERRATLLPTDNAPKRFGWLKWLVAVVGCLTLGGAGWILWRQYDSATSASARKLGPVRADSIGPSERLNTLLGRHGIDTAQFDRALTLIGVAPDSIARGTVVTLRERARSPIISQVSFRDGPDRRLDVRLTRNVWVAQKETVAWYGAPTVIKGSFHADNNPVIDAVQADSLPRPIREAFLLELADALWQIEFGHRVKAGDRFRVVARLERSSDGDQRLRDVRAIELSLGKDRIVAYNFEPTNGPPGYFDDRGRSLRRPFLRTPLAAHRTTSEYTNYRFHPILGVGRAHRGVDYGAPEGSVVLAAAAGTVRIAGEAGDFGILLEIDHGNGVSTRYAHLKSIAAGIRPGVAVTLGRPVAYVGQTGLATAPHLHYEFRIRGEPVDMRWLEVDVGQPIADGLIGAFETERNRLRSLLDQAPRN